MAIFQTSSQRLSPCLSLPWNHRGVPSLFSLWWDIGELGWGGGGWSQVKSGASCTFWCFVSNRAAFVQLSEGKRFTACQSVFSNHRHTASIHFYLILTEVMLDVCFILFPWVSSIKKTMGFWVCMCQSVSSLSIRMAFRTCQRWKVHIEIIIYRSHLWLNTTARGDTL